MRNLYTRTITGVIFVALILGTLIWHPLAFVTVIYVIMLAGLLEFYQLTGNKGMSPDRITGLLTGSVFYIVPVLASLGIISPKYIVILPLFIFLLFIAELYRNKANSMQNIASGIFSVTYISIPLSILTFLLSSMISSDRPHWHIVFSFFIILWSHDTFAYLTGMAIGKHKLFEKISPKKTWEGSIGGTVFGLIAAFVLSLFFKELTTWQWLAGALVIIVSGTFGDLAESLLKRNFDVKDSGRFFPGHGGVLDRFDAVLFAAPALFCYLILLNL